MRISAVLAFVAALGASSVSATEAPWEAEIASLRAEVAELKAMLVAEPKPLRRKLQDGMTTVELLETLGSTSDDHETRIAAEEENTALQSCITYTQCS